MGGGEGNHRRGLLWITGILLLISSLAWIAWLILIALGLTGCSLFFDSPLQLERQALRHVNKALDHAQRLIPLLQVQDWERAYTRTAGAKGELEMAVLKLDQALKGWARRGQSPLSYELDALELLNEVAKNNEYIQEKLKGEITIAASTQKRLIEKAKGNAKDLERAAAKLEKAIEKHLQPEPGEGS